MGDFSKILKFIQYFSVLTSEYELSKHHLRGCGVPSSFDDLFGGKSLSSDQSAEMKLRWKKLGSAISTTRMISRLGDFFENLKFFVGKINDLRSGKTTMKHQCPIEWFKQLVDFFSGIFDNWVLLERINLTKFNTPW